MNAFERQKQLEAESIIKEKNKKGCIIISVFIIIFFIILLFIEFFPKNVDPTNYYEQELNIELPENMTVEYNIKETGWFGEGERYTVFKLKTEPSTEFLEEFNSKAIDGPIEKNFTAIISNLNIPEGFLPNWKEDYYWISRCARCAYIVYFPDSLSLLICYSII